MSLTSNSTRRTLRKYQQAKGYIIEMVNSGRLMRGQPLPSEVQMSETVGIARNTLRQAIGELVDEGVLQKVPGKGAFVSLKDEEQELGHSISSDQFALITPEVERNIYPSIIKGFVRGGKSHGHRATVCDAHYDLGRQADAILEILVRHAAGVAMVPVIPMVTPAYHVEVLQNSGIPVVCCIRPVPNVQVPLVSWDFGKRMARACQILLERGHRRFGYFASFKYSLPEHHVRIIRETISGSGAELLDHNINYGSRLGVLEEADKLASLKRILRAKDRPTGIICNDATEAELVYVLAGQLGFEIPAELSIVGLGGIYDQGIIRERMTSVNVDSLGIGEIATEILNDMRKGKLPVKNSQKILLECQVYEGRTVSSPAC